jgi:NAD(P)-dependent dehydrogenase (short-subunit alcohol dehydrogenase family)
MRVPTIEGRVVLVTGAASGIGAAAVRELARRGARPVLVDVDADALAALAATLPGAPLAVVADVVDPAACAAAVEAALARHGRLDVAWANAGIASFGPLAHTDPGAWRRCVEVNLVGAFETVRAALPALLRARGYVAATASVASFAHPPTMSAYAASKAGVEAMCNAWRIELAAHGVGVGVIHAAWVRTPLVEEGALHPAFRRLRATVPRAFDLELGADEAACAMVDGIARRERRIFVPARVRWLHRLRAWLHEPRAERGLLRAMPEIERHYLEGLAAEGALASSFGPRERARSEARERG